MTSQTHSDEIRYIPYRQLTLSPYNVRRTNAEDGLEELATLIAAQGVLQNLVVHPNEGSKHKRPASFGVAAGGRRLHAVALLIKRRKLKPNVALPCRVTTLERAIAVSLAENSGRKEMHPADQCEAFKQLIEAGKSIEDVAAAFGVTPLVVRRRLKLANVCPDLTALYRSGDIELDQMMALALSDDHARQLEVWNSLRPSDRHPHTIKRLLTENEVSCSEAMARFVGLKAYEKAGGAVRRDLFSEAEQGYIMDAELLQRLANEKLQSQVEPLRKDGYAWVETTLHLDYAELSKYRRVQRIDRELTVKERKRLDAITAKRAKVQAQIDAAAEDDERISELNDTLDELDAQEAALQEATRVPDPAQQARAGAIVSIGPDGHFSIERGLLRREDAAALTADDETQPKEKVKRVHSGALVQRLTAQRTLALRAELATRSELALIALTHRLVLSTFYLPLPKDCGSALLVKPEELDLKPLIEEGEPTQAQRALDAQKQILLARLPHEPHKVLAWLAEQPQRELLELLAYCVACTLDYVQNDEQPHVGDALAQVAKLDMHRWWSPTAENYFGSVSKARMVEVVTEALSAQAALPLSKMKKALAAQAAERALAGTTWLPAPLRVSA